jgi:hypothetical protein
VKPRTSYPCRKCHCTYKVQGDTWLEVAKPVRAVDGTKAFRIVWLCHSGHRTFRGYSRPVSWKKNLGGDKIITADNLQSFEEEENDIEKEYLDLLKSAQLAKESSTGKRFF